jgi:hypothetical protein
MSTGRRWTCLLALLLPGSAVAQPPLATDDAAVAPFHSLHLELFQQSVELRPSKRPFERQHTTVLTLGYGLTRRIEVGFDLPWIEIQRQGHDVKGLGDWNLTAKAQLRRPDPERRRSALALGFAVELPTGDEERSLGSGLTDYGLDLIFERPLGRRHTLRANGGAQFAGDTSTGVVGARIQGTVFSGGLSLTRDLAGGWYVAAELSGFEGREEDQADRELWAQVATGRTLSSRWGLAAALQRGWQGSPPWQLQLGVTFDP